MGRTPLALLLLPTLLLGRVSAQDKEKDKAPPTFAELKKAFKETKKGTLSERIVALEKFAACKTKECVRFLDALRQSGVKEGLRLEAIRTIGEVGVDPARSVLEGILDGSQARQKPAALEALALLRPKVPVKRFLDQFQVGKPEAMRNEAGRALGNYPSAESAAVLVAALCEEPRPDWLERAARQSLRRIAGEPEVDAWLVEKALLDPAYAVAMPTLIRMAGHTAHADAEAAVRPHLRNQLAEARAAAADALGVLAAGKASAAQETLDLLAALLRDPDPGVVLSAGVAVATIGPAGKALKAVHKLARSKSPGMRAIAIEALRSCTDKDSRKLVRKALRDSSRSVRAAAVGTAQAHGDRAAVGALVEALQKDDAGRLGAEIRLALRALTGANPGEAPEDWERWWEMVRADYELPQERQPSDPGATSSRGPDAKDGPPKYYGEEIVSRRLCFVVDVSGSMSAKVGDESRMAVCKRELTTVIGGLPKKTYFNLIWFHHKFAPWGKQLQPASKKGKRSALKWVDGLKAQGGTNIYDPLEAALLDPDVDTVYLLSDGAPGSGKFTHPDDILREVQKLNAARQVAIHTISIGRESKLMKELAEQNAGKAIVR